MVKVLTNLSFLHYSSSDIEGNCYFRTVKIIRNLSLEDPVFLFSFNKIYFLDCVENLWIRKSQREHFSYK